MMIQSFKNKGTQDVFNGKNSQQARRICPTSTWSIAARKLDLLDSAESVDDLRIPPGNRLEIMTDDRKGLFSIRINDQYRICFIWTYAGPSQVEIVDYHKS